jgi:peroxiredoxin
MLAQGDPAPWFEGRSSVRPTLLFQNLGGQYVVLSFLGSATFAPSRQIIEEIERERGYFDVCDANFFAVSIDPDDEKQGRLRQKFPRVYYLWDFDASISRLYGAACSDGKYLVHSLVLDPNLRDRRPAAPAGLS